MRRSHPLRVPLYGKCRNACIVIVLGCSLRRTELAMAQNSNGAMEAPWRQASAAVKAIRAPASPDTQWATPDLRVFSDPLRLEQTTEIDPQKDYELSELIDLAERTNPETRVAWERAKEAASAVGLARSEYYPVLALKASGEWARLPEPLPLTPQQAGYMDLEAQQARTVAELQWVLLDFGRRAAEVGAARNRLLAANLGFNARHQQIVFKVQTAFYGLSTVRGRITVAQTALELALKVEEAGRGSVQARAGDRARGFAGSPTSGASGF